MRAHPQSSKCLLFVVAGFVGLDTVVATIHGIDPQWYAGLLYVAAVCFYVVCSDAVVLTDKRTDLSRADVPS